MRDPRWTEGSHGAWQKGANDGRWRSHRCGIFISRIGDFGGNLRREVMGRCGGMGQHITVFSMDNVSNILGLHSLYLH